MSNRADATLLVDAAASALRAPSVHNTQPWRFLAGPDGLELWAERSRQLRAIDPQGRLLTVSCGAVLQHVTAILAARGWQARVDRLPDPQQPDLLARIRLGEPIEATAEAMRIVHAMGMRHTDRRPVADTTLSADTFEVIRAAAVAAGAGLQVLDAEHIAALARASMKANELGVNEPDQRDELYYWVGGMRLSGSGVPDTSLPDRPVWTEVPGRDFTRVGSLHIGEGRALRATHTILYCAGDTLTDWLVAGEAMSACWLKATDLGVAVLPLSTVIEVAVTREALRLMLPAGAYPMLVMRFGIPDPQLPAPALTPRLQPEEVLTRSTGQ